MSNKVIYNDFAVYAEKYATVPAAGSSPYQSGGNLLKEETRELINYATFTNRGINLLDSTLEFAEESDTIGYISVAASNSLRVYEPAVDIVIDLANGYYSAPGITFHFWQNYCTEISVKWYSDGAEISSATFYPVFSNDENRTNMLTYYGENPVEDFNKVVISFVKSETANQFVKLAGIDLGKQNTITDFHSNIEMFFEIDPDTADVPGATCEFVAKIDGFEPTEAQTLYVYRKEKLFGKFTVKNVTPNGKRRYLITCVDDVMNSDNSDAPVCKQAVYVISELVEYISTLSNINFDLSQVTHTKLAGFIEKDKSNRYAIAQIAFGTNSFVSGYGSKTLKLFKPRNRRNKVITSDMILGKAEYKKVTPYTAVTLKFFENDFNTVISTMTAQNPQKNVRMFTNEKIFEQYSLFADFEPRFDALLDAGYSRNEITARIELTDESLGDILSVETPYNGIKKGIIKAMEISLGHKVLAKLTLIERDFSAYGGDG